MSPASDNQISQASLPTWAGALFSCRLSSFWQSAGLQNHRPLVRIRPHENPNFLQTENRQRISTLAVFLWARVDYASRASKKAPQGLFPPPDCSAGRCCSNPPLRVKLKMQDKTKNQRNFYAGFFGGRGWIRTTEAEKQQIYSLSPLATREHAQILFTSVAGRLVYFIRLRAICQLLFSDFCSFSAETVGRISFGSDVSGARNPARRQWLRRTWGRGQ